ncbi:hypothetical protein HD554DRAFT_1809958 [Boletus coccyginus]|nr:hypothetical protein HD554DRAFT_1809958 [Boletus coccyginus]
MPNSTSFTQLVAIYFKSFLFMVALHALFVAISGIILHSTDHIAHLAGYWGFMAGVSGACLLLGLCSARKHGEWVKHGRVALLVSSLAQTSGGIVLLSDHFSVITMIALAPTAGSLYMLDYAYIMAVTKVGEEVSEGYPLHDVTHSSWVASIAAWLSGTQEQRSTSSHEMSGLSGKGNLKLWLSRVAQIRRPQLIPEITPSEEKEHLLPNSLDMV